MTAVCRSSERKSSEVLTNLKLFGRRLSTRSTPVGTSASRGVPEVALLKSSFPVAGAQISSKNHYLPGQIVWGAASRAAVDL